MSGQLANAALVRAHDLRGPGNNAGMPAVRALPMVDHCRRAVCNEHRQFRGAVLGAGTIQVAPGQRARHRGGQGGRVVHLGCIIDQGTTQEARKAALTAMSGNVAGGGRK